MNFDTAKLRTGEIVAAVGAILLFVFMFFFKWYGLSLPGGASDIAKSLGVDLGSVGVNGWNGHSVLRWLMLLTIIAAIGLAFVTATQRTVALPVTGAVLTTAIAGLTTVLLAYRVVLNEPGPNDVIDVKIGAWLGLIATAMVAYGGYLSMREEGTSLADAREQARSAGSQARAAFDSAPHTDTGTSSAPPPPPPPPAAAPAPPAPAPAPPAPAAVADPPPAPAAVADPPPAPAAEPTPAPTAFPTPTDEPVADEDEDDDAADAASPAEPYPPAS